MTSGILCLAVLRITYSDGQRGVLFVSCALLGTPSTVYEGAHATKGFVDYFAPVLHTKRKRNPVPLRRLGLKRRTLLKPLAKREGDEGIICLEGKGSFFFCCS